MIGSVRTPRLAGKCRSGMVHVSAPKPPGGATRRHGNADLRPVLPVGAGTARRRRANGAVLLSPTVQTRPMITAQIRKVQGRVRRKKAPFAALRAAVSTRGRRSLAGAPLCSISIAPLAPLRGAVPTGGRRSKRSPRFIAVGSTRFRGPGGPRCRSETGAPSGPRDSSRSGVCVFAALSGRDAGRRPAFQAVPAIHRGRQSSRFGDGAFLGMALGRAVL